MFGLQKLLLRWEFNPLRRFTCRYVNNNVSPRDGQRHQGVKEDKDDNHQRVGLALDPPQNRMNVIPAIARTG